MLGKREAVLGADDEVVQHANVHERQGVFEPLGDESIYSKLQTGQFPDEDAMLAELDKRL